jgi:hypothetical protein
LKQDTGHSPPCAAGTVAAAYDGAARPDSALPGHQFVVLAYGESPYLGACLESVAANAGDSRVLVATSTPSAFVDAAAARHGFPVLACAGGRGIAHDWNFALESATEPLVTLAHQDDIYAPAFALATRQLVRDTPDACLAFTGYGEIDPDGAVLPDGRVMQVKRLIQHVALGPREVARERWRRRALLALGSAIPCPSVSINRAVVPRFRFSSAFQINLDWDGWWRLHDTGHPFVRSARVLMWHRIHPEAETTRGKGDGRRREEDGRMFRRIWPWPASQVLSSIYKCGY